MQTRPSRCIAKQMVILTSLAGIPLLGVISSASAHPSHWAAVHGYNDRHDYSDNRVYHYHEHHHYHHGPGKDYYRKHSHYRFPDHDRYANHGYGQDVDQHAGYGSLGTGRQTVGGLIGGAVGGMVGSQIGKGSGRLAATAASTLAGYVIGGSIGRYMDEVDRYRSALGPWRNPDH
jgi:hypothetical protein